MCLHARPLASPCTSEEVQSVVFHGSASDVLPPAAGPLVRDVRGRHPALGGVTFRRSVPDQSLESEGQEALETAGATFDVIDGAFDCLGYVASRGGLRWAFFL